MVDMGHDGEIADMREVGHGGRIWSRCGGLSRGSYLRNAQRERTKNVPKEKPFEDLAISAQQTAICRELLRSIGLYWELQLGARPEFSKDELLLFAVLRALATVAAGVDVDQNHFALQFLNTTRKDSPQEIYNVRGSYFMAVLQNLLLSNCADSFSNTSSSTEHLEEAIDKLHRLGKLGSKPGLVYNHEGLLILVPEEDQYWARRLFQLDFDYSDADGPPSLTPDEHFVAALPLVKSLRMGKEAWSYWLRWYASLLRGLPVNQELQQNVALIPDDIWYDGPQAVAAAIAEIEREFDGGPATDAIEAERERSGDALKRHVRRLLEQSAATEFNALGLAWQIKSAIDAYCNENGVNETPEELRSFEAIADVLSRIGGGLAQAQVNDEIKDQATNQLEAQIAELQLRIKSLEKELVDSKAKEVKGLIKNGFYTGISASLTVACTSTVVSAATYFVAPEHAPEIVRHLGDRFF
ncbi:MAG: hypothetical protein HKN18_04885 [Silicimonas sp.]|nr:hypothetical protein [Silicimonas sp.]